MKHQLRIAVQQEKQAFSEILVILKYQWIEFLHSKHVFHLTVMSSLDDDFLSEVRTQINPKSLSYTRNA